MTQKLRALQTLKLIDLTSLNTDDDDKIILDLCQTSQTKFANVPAICIYPKFIQLAHQYFTKHNLAIKIATVTNFPHGNDNLANAITETQKALDLGADEIDIVLPYQALIAGNSKICEQIVAQAKQVCGNKTLKVIIESGVLQTSPLIKLASQISVDNGADFIKTSTGKVPVNATLEATEIMLNVIKQSGRLDCGFKAAGGIKLVSEATKYLELTESIMGTEWVKAECFRFGASSLLGDILNVLHNRDSVLNNSAY
jgi:deoxyribose-phosphate aldolase